MEFIGTILSTMNTRGSRSTIKRLIINVIDKKKKIVYYIPKEIELNYTKFLFFSEKYAVIDLDNDIYNFLLKGIIGMDEESIKNLKNFLEKNRCYKILVLRKYSDYIFQTFRNVYNKIVYITTDFELAKKIRCREKYYLINYPLDEEVRNDVVNKYKFKLKDFGILYANKKIID